MASTTQWQSRLKRLFVHEGSAGLTRPGTDLPVDPIAKFGLRNYLDLAFQILVGRHIDENGLRGYTGLFETDQITRGLFLQRVVQTDEFKLRILQEDLPPAAKCQLWLHAMHAAREQIIVQLPKAARILDLGGSCQGRPEGAMIAFGYPYAFESLTITDLPRDQRHDIYAEICGDYTEVVPTSLGPVRYVYTTLADLSAFADSSIDLVYSGQSIEHVTQDDAVAACREVYRVLKPGGEFCLDTPNRAVTKLEFPDQFINPDHKHEYTHAELSGLLEKHGFSILEAKGLCRFARSVEQGRFDMDEGIMNAKVYADIENCYLLYYRCRKPR